VAAVAAIGAMVATPGASAGAKLSYIRGVSAPGTPKWLDRVGILKIGPQKASNVLVLNPGTSAGSAYFAPLARTLVKQLPDWQVWSVERRENRLEDQSVLNDAKQGDATPQELFEYYLGWVTDSSIDPHVQLLPDDQVAFARDWGMKVEVGDLRKVVKAAGELGGKVVLGGHSLGGSITTAYATWDFNGKPGAKGLSGLVFIDGGSSPTPITQEEAQQKLADLQTSSPWLAFGGIGAPFAGLFADTGGGLAKMDPNAPSILQTFPALPPDLHSDERVTNEAGFGYPADTETSPASLAAFQVHAGHLAASGDPRTWDRAGELTPIQRYASMLSGWGLQGLDGTAWYHPMRLTIDAGAVGDGNANPAQQVLGVKSTHGDDIKIPMYAFGAGLGDGRVLDAAQALADQSGLPQGKLTLIDRHRTYAHNDPNSAFPHNVFVAHLVPFLEKISG
jgi:pimeloyl-ACP methyl ester carboxylesterase